jgi:hypothetical protein
VPQAKTSGKIINTTSIIGGNIKTKNDSLRVASLAYYYPLYHITPPVTSRALLELMQTWSLGLLLAAVSVQLACMSEGDCTKAEGGFAQFVIVIWPRIKLSTTPTISQLKVGNPTS